MGFIKQQHPLIITKNKKEYNLSFTLEESVEELEDLVIEIDNTENISNFIVVNHSRII